MDQGPASESDRSDNLTRLVGTDEGGNDLFLYDKVSRLKEARIQVPTDRGDLLFGDGFESATSQRWLEAWPPSGWSPGLKTQLFTFDRFGNLTKVETTGQPTENFPTTETTNRMSSTIATYDSRGNLKTYNNGTTSFENSFDALNRQWKRLAPDGTDDNYLYSADDERILTFSPNVELSWHRILRDFGGKVLRNYEFINSDPPAADFVAAVKDYIHAGERVLGTEDPRVPGASAMYATVDHLGTPRLWTDASGNDVRKLKYYPFGKEATPSDQWNVALQFTGHERDRNDLATATDDGDYMHARNSSPIAARLLSVDPIGGQQESPQSWNRFAYVTGNPMRFLDPSGQRLALPGQNWEEALRMLKLFAGPEGAPLLYTEEEDGVTYVDYTGKQKDSLAATGEENVYLADIIDSPITTELSVAEAFDSKLGRFEVGAPGVGFGGAATVGQGESLSGNIQIFIRQDAAERLNLANSSQNLWSRSSGNPLFFDGGIVAGHEIGHAWANLRGDGTTSNLSNLTANRVENLVRMRLGLLDFRVKH